MDDRQFAYFVAVAEAGGFTRAMDRLGSTQSTISATIRRLEREIGVQLLERDPRRVSLSPAGHALLPQARRLITAVEEARAAVGASGAEPRGEVGVGTVGFTLGVDVMHVVAGVRRAHPLITPRIITRRTPDELVEDVRDARADLAVTVTLTPESPPPGVDFTILDSEEFQLLVAPSHALAGLPAVRPEQLGAEEFVCFPWGSSQRIGMDDVFRRLGIEPRVGFESDGPAHLRLVLESGVCCVGLRTPTAFFAPEIRAVPFAVEAPRAATVLALPHSSRRTSATQLVADALLAAFAAVSLD